MSMLRRFFLLSFFVISSNAFASEYSLQPTNINATEGELISVDLVLAATDSWTGGNVGLGFDSSVLSFVNFEFNPLLLPQLNPASGSMDDVAGPTPDLIDSVFFIKDIFAGPSLPGVYNIGSFNFLASGPGITSLTLVPGFIGIGDALVGLEGALPVTFDLDNIPQVNVSAVPLPAAAWLFIGGLGMLGMARRRKQA